MPNHGGPEQIRVDEMRSRRAHWNRWGPFLSQRAWGTVREDYSAHSDAWEYLPFRDARFRTYRWNEDGLLGLSDRHQLICFAPALWNGRDPILKDRLFGLTGKEGNHGEDVKEVYYFLDSTPTHSYMKALYRYPQSEFPYDKLLQENRRRTRLDPEYEITDTGVFAENRYFDVQVEYAKIAADDLLIRITVANRGPEAAVLHLLQTIWFRNTWSWGYPVKKPELRQTAPGAIELNEPYYGRRWFYAKGADELLFTENETNSRALWGTPNATPYTKDGIDACVVRGQASAVNPDRHGTKAAARYTLTIPAGGQTTIQARLTNSDQADPF